MVKTSFYILLIQQVPDFSLIYESLHYIELGLDKVLAFEQEPVQAKR